MVSRRPLVRISGKTQQLPEGDFLAGTEFHLPVYQSQVAAVLVGLMPAGRGMTLAVYDQSGEAHHVRVL